MTTSSRSRGSVPTSITSRPTYTTGLSTAPLSTSPVQPTARTNYPTTLPSLGAADFADLAARRRTATRGLQEALARGEAGKETAQAQYEFALSRLQDRFSAERGGALQSLAARGLARQPRFAGRALRGIRNQEQDQAGQLGVQRAEQLAAIEAAVAAARSARDGELGQLEAEEVRRRSDLSRLIRQIGA